MVLPELVIDNESISLLFTDCLVKVFPLHCMDSPKLTISVVLKNTTFDCYCHLLYTLTASLSHWLIQNFLVLCPWCRLHLMNEYNQSPSDCPDWFEIAWLRTFRHQQLHHDHQKILSVNGLLSIIHINQWDNNNMIPGSHFATVNDLLLNQDIRFFYGTSTSPQTGIVPMTYSLNLQIINHLQHKYRSDKSVHWKKGNV